MNSQRDRALALSSSKHRGSAHVRRPAARPVSAAVEYKLAVAARSTATPLTHTLTHTEAGVCVASSAHTSAAGRTNSAEFGFIFIF